MQATERLGAGAFLLRTDPQTGALRAREYLLTVLSGPDAGKELRFSGTLRVGTQPDVEFVLTDGAVSRLHLEVRARADGLWVKDLQSTNGTFVAGARIDEAMLEDETTLRVGKSLLRLSILEQALDVPESPRTHFGDALGQSRAMRRMFALLERVSPTDAAVILWGETGTGKDALARAIHSHSERRQSPFVVFDCSAVAANLAESELFGHVKGSFTGASSDRRGAFLEASGGTLFLDEIGELPLDLQPKLLRALEAGTVKRVGEDRYRSVDVRIVAATHKNLEAEVAAGRFRQDLYYRLAVVLIRVPPLRERPEDLPLLARHFLKQLEQEEQALSPALLARMTAYEWPGNVRELRNFISRAVLGTELAPLGGALNPQGQAAEAAATQVDVDIPYKEAKERLVELFTREYIEALLARHDGNISQAAKAAGLARTYVHRLVVRYGLRASDDS